VLAHGRVGVDVEELPPAGEDMIGVAEVVATPAELDELRALAEESRPAAFQRWWVRKEAVLKAEGTGFLTDPRAVHVGVTVVAPPSPWVVLDLGLLDGPGCPALAVATERPAPGRAPHRIFVSRRALGDLLPP
jgi:4'-phosphopantetheinyl transferase